MAAEVHWARKTEEWLRAAKPDSNNITHGMIDHAQCAARLGQGEVLHEVLTRLACCKYLFPSMMMSYWPGQNGFGFDPVGTMPEVVHNALIFSLDGQVDLLQALPKDRREQRVLFTVDQACHHVTMYDNEHFFAHHPPGHMGMCFGDLTSGPWRDLRYGDFEVQGKPCHSIATAQGIAYEVLRPNARHKEQGKAPCNSDYRFSLPPGASGSPPCCSRRWPRCTLLMRRNRCRIGRLEDVSQRTSADR